MNWIALLFIGVVVWISCSGRGHNRAQRGGGGVAIAIALALALAAGVAIYLMSKKKKTPPTPKTCSGFKPEKCGTGQKVKSTNTCAAAVCTAKECCVADDGVDTKTCSGFDCGTGKKVSVPSKECAAALCTVPECCVADDGDGAKTGGGMGKCDMTVTKDSAEAMGGSVVAGLTDSYTGGLPCAGPDAEPLDEYKEYTQCNSGMGQPIAWCHTVVGEGIDAEWAYCDPSCKKNFPDLSSWAEGSQAGTINGVDTEDYGVKTKVLGSGCPGVYPVGIPPGVPPTKFTGHTDCKTTGCQSGWSLNSSKEGVAKQHCVSKNCSTEAKYSSKTGEKIWPPWCRQRWDN